MRVVVLILREIVDILVFKSTIYVQTVEREKEEEKARRRVEKQPGFDGRWYTDVNAHKKFVHIL